MITESTQIPRILNKAVHHFDGILAKRIFYAVEAQIKKGFGVQKDIYNELWIDVPTYILNNQHYDDLLKASKELQKARFEFNDPENESFSHIVPFPSVQYQKRWGYMKVKVEKEAYPILAEITKGYFWIKLKAVMGLSSKYSQRWYELFSEKKDLREWKNVTVDFIRKILDIKIDEYKRNTDFLQWIVYEPIKEINSLTDLFISFKPIKGEKKRIIGFDFNIQSQDAKGESEVLEKIEKYFEGIKALSPNEQVTYLLWLKKEYTISDKEYGEMMMEPIIKNEILKAHANVETGKTTIKTTKQQFMKGVIKQAKLKLKASQD